MLKLWGIRGVSEKYPTFVHICALVLFFVIRTVASFEVVLIWLNQTLPAVLSHLKAVLERRFWNGPQLAPRIALNRLDVVEPLFFERHFQLWEHSKVAGNYVGTVRRLAKQYNLVFRQKLLHKVRWMRLARYRGEEASHRLTRNAVVFSHGITQSFQNFNVIFFVDRLTSWSKFAVHNTLTIKKIISIDLSTKAFCIIPVVSVQLLPRLKQNLMQIRWSVYNFYLRLFIYNFNLGPNTMYTRESGTKLRLNWD